MGDEEAARRRRIDRIEEAADAVFAVIDELAIFRRNHLPSSREPIYHQALRRRFAEAMVQLARAIASAILAPGRT